jgi:hypothetical protein
MQKAPGSHLQMSGNDFRIGVGSHFLRMSDLQNEQKRQCRLDPAFSLLKLLIEFSSES